MCGYSKAQRASKSSFKAGDRPSIYAVLADLVYYVLATKGRTDPVARAEPVELIPSMFYFRFEFGDFHPKGLIYPICAHRSLSQLHAKRLDTLIQAR